MQNFSTFPARMRVQLPDTARRRIEARYAAVEQAQTGLRNALADMAVALGLEGAVEYDRGSGMLSVRQEETDGDTPAEG